MQTFLFIYDILLDLVTNFVLPNVLVGGVAEERVAGWQPISVTSLQQSP